MPRGRKKKIYYDVPKPEENKRGKYSSPSESSKAEEVDLTVLTTIHSLPEELLLQIFSFLPLGDTLQTRLVSKTWNQTVSTWSKFNSKVLYLVKSGTESRSVLKQTQTSWKKIKLEKFRLTEKNNEFNLPSQLFNVTNSVSFSKSIVSWDSVKQILIQFKELNEIEIIQCKRRRKEVNKSPSSRLTRAILILNESLSTLLKNVKCIKLELRRISDMIFYLKEFNEHKMSLTELHLKDVYDGMETVTKEAANELLEFILKIIQKSHQTLKVLRINFVTLSLVNGFFPNVIENLKNTPLDLSVFEVRHFAPEPSNQRDLTIFSNFIQTQKNLIETRLPLPGDSSTEQCRNIVRLINSKIKSLHITSEKYIVQGFLDNFKDLKTANFDFEIRQFILNSPAYEKITEILLEKGIMSLTVPLLADKFPNLTSLNLNGDCEDVPPIDDRCLQAISQNLKKIRVLVIGACARITDYGVTGIRKEYCEKIFKSRALCLDNGMQIPREFINGSPLHSLKGLTSLTFTGPTAITDVGIYFGFRFNELHYLNMRNNVDISDWGLEWMGKLNPNLDWIYIGCGPWVTQVGINRLKCRLRRIKRRNSIYIWPNQEYYSSDESYAMESNDEFG